MLFTISTIFVLSRSDWWKSLLVGLPRPLLDKLPWARNNVAHIFHIFQISVDIGDIKLTCKFQLAFVFNLALNFI